MTPRPPLRPAPIPRGRRAIAPAPKAGRATANVIARFSKSFGSGFGDLATRWSEIVDAKTARMCTPIKLTGRGANGVLHVAAPGPAALLVEANAQRILDQVNTYCGREVAKRLAITRASAARRPGLEGDDLTPSALRVTRRSAPPAPRPSPSPAATLKLEAELASIDDPRLKAALMKLGRETLTASARHATPKRPTGGDT